MQVRRGITRDPHVINLFNADSRRAQAILDRSRGEPGAVLDAIEALFFNRGDQFTIANERRRRIAVISVDSENYHLADDA